MGNRKKHRVRSCTRKVRYVTIEAVIKAWLRTQREIGDMRMQPYKCKICGGWHYGHVHRARPAQVVETWAKFYGIK